MQVLVEVHLVWEKMLVAARFRFISEFQLGGVASSTDGAGIQTPDSSSSKACLSPEVEQDLSHTLARQRIEIQIKKAPGQSWLQLQ